LTELRFYPDPASIALNNLLTDRQSHSRAGILIGGMKSFEDAEYLKAVFGIDAYTVVSDRENPFGGSSERYFNAFTRRF
jgi:hypothetical protein